MGVREKSARYLAVVDETAAMEPVAKGYKLTDIGLLPEDWHLEPMRTLLSQSATYGVVKAGRFVSIGIPMLRGGDIKNGRIDASALPMISAEKSAEYSRTVLRSGDVVIALVGYPGEAAVVDTDLEGSNISRAVGLLRPTGILPHYLCSYLNSPSGRSEFLKPGAGSAQLVVNLRDLNHLLVPLPCPDEQKKIAAALSDTDALIESLQQLIAKKHAIKQCAMQALLTGRQRLPSCSSEWKQVSFSDVVRHHSGNSILIKGKLPSSPSVGLYPGFSASGQDVWCESYEHEGNAFVVSAVGSRCGKAFRASGKWSAIANTHVIWPDRTKVDDQYLGYFINDEDFWVKSGTGQPFVLFMASLSKQFALPSIQEQAAIATVLSDMDADIDALETRLAKTRALKAGMMQALLTGGIRLPLD